MRILFLTHRLPHAPNRGDRVRAYHLLTELARWATVDLVSLVHNEDETGHVEELKSLTATVTVGPVHRWRNTVRAGLLLPGSTPTTHTMLRANGLASAIERLTARVRHDLVLSYCTGVGPLTELRCLESVPLALDMVDVDSAKWEELARTAGPPLSWVYRREARTLSQYETRLVRRASLTTVVTPRERETLLRLVPDGRIEVLANGVALDHLRPSREPTDRPVVVFCGVMNYAPNVEGVEWFVRRVWPMVLRARPDARFVVVGSDPAPRVLRLAREPGVEITGSVADVRPYLWDAAVSVAPLLTARGVQNKVLEAVAAGVPAVVTRPVSMGLPPEVLAACRIHADPDAFCAAVLSLLKLTGAERRAITGAVDLDSLTWPKQFAALQQLLTAAARSEH